MRVLVHGQHFAVPHHPAAVHHHRLDVAALALMHEVGDDAQTRHQMRSAQVDHDQIGLVAGDERSRHRQFPSRDSH